MTDRQQEIEQNFWSKVKKTNGKCWEWSGWINSSGYGNFVFKKKIYSAHRFIFNLKGFPIRKTEVVDHICKNRKCVKLSHLRIVTPEQNTLENSNSPSAKNKLKTYCPKKHPLYGKNLMLHKNGKKAKNLARRCRICERANFRRLWKLKNGKQ